MFKFVVDAGSQPEELNKKAVAIINRVRDKLTGTCRAKFCSVTVPVNLMVNNSLLFDSHFVKFLWRLLYIYIYIYIYLYRL